MFRRADNDSVERLRISRIEELLSLCDSRDGAKLHTPRATNKFAASSPRTRFIEPASKPSSLYVAAPIPVKIFENATVSDKEACERAKSATENKHWEKLLSILGFSDQRVRTREVNKELENLRENLKQMKGRVNLMTERLDFPEQTQMASLPLEPHERFVSITTALANMLARFVSTGRSKYLQELASLTPATGLRDVTGVEKLLQMQAEELQVCPALRLRVTCNLCANLKASASMTPPYQREKTSANERLTAFQAQAHVQQQQIRANLETENVREIVHLLMLLNFLISFCSGGRSARCRSK